MAHLGIDKNLRDTIIVLAVLAVITILLLVH
jgi:hypothetical protein